MVQTMRSRLRQVVAGAVLAGALFWPGCEKKDDVAVYEVPKEHEHMPTPPSEIDQERMGESSAAQAVDPEQLGERSVAEQNPGAEEKTGVVAAVPDGEVSEAPGGTAMMRALAKGMQWEVPQEWRRVGTKAQQMRLATFEAGKGAGLVDISVTVLPGDAGGLLANINRWRGQLGLEPVERIEEQPISTVAMSDGREAKLVELWATAGQGGTEPAKGIVAAVIERDQKTWFVKATGLRDAVLGQREAVEQFVGSMRWTREMVVGD